MKTVRLTEQDIQDIVNKLITEQEKIYDYGDGYDYKVVNGKWFASKEGANKWFSMDKYPDSVKNLDRKFPQARKNGESKTPTNTKQTPSNKTTDNKSLNQVQQNAIKNTAKEIAKTASDIKFDSVDEGNDFRGFVNRYLPGVAKKYDLDTTGSHKNSYIIKSASAFVSFKANWRGFKKGERTMVYNVWVKANQPKEDIKKEGGDNSWISKLKNVLLTATTLISLPIALKPFMFILDNILEMAKSRIPLHLRAFGYYLAGREEPLTENDLTPEELEYLKTAVISNEKSGLTYGMWKSLSDGQLPTSIEKSGEERDKIGDADLSTLSNPDLAGQFMYTLGQVTPQNIKISPDKKTVIVYDRYDMNTEGKKLEDVTTEFTDHFNKWWNEDEVTFYSVVRKAAEFREVTGYKGYQIKINV